MMKAIFLGMFFVFLCVLIPGLVGVYHSVDRNEVHEEETGKDFVSNEGENELNAPEVQAKPNLILHENENNSDDQPIAYTKEEAVEAILDQFTLMELLSLYSNVQNGITKQDKEKILAMLEERFTEEEIEALKVIGFSDLEKVLY
jgi:hypothetical protein